MCIRDRVSADAAWVIITRPGDEAWPQDLQEALGAHPPGGANARRRGGRTAGGRHIVGVRRPFVELVCRRRDARAELHALGSAWTGARTSSRRKTSSSKGRLTPTM